MGIYDREYYQDEVRPLRPWDGKSMVTILIIINVAVHIANFVLTSNNDAITRFLAVRSDTIMTPMTWWRFITYGFSHQAGIGHLLFNMISLYFLGRSVEDRLGKWEFLRFYLIALSLCGVLWSVSHSEGSLIGASGACTAVAMLFVFCFPQATLLLYMAIPVKAWVLGIVIIVGNLFQPTSPTPGEAQVAYDVHLVGAAFAAVYFFGKLNFSSLGAVFGNLKSNYRKSRSKLKVHRPDTPDRDALESDRILDKIYREGEESLTSKERKFMEKYSKRIRQKRDD